MSAVFHGRDKRLLLVGDPKQAIYSFRGADVRVYGGGKERACTRDYETNWRSDAQYVAAMNRLFNAGTKSLGLDSVDYIEVLASRNIRRRASECASLEWPPSSAIRASLGGCHGRAEAGPVSNKARGALSARLAAREAAALLSEGASRQKGR